MLDAAVDGVCAEPALECFFDPPALPGPAPNLAPEPRDFVDPSELGGVRKDEHEKDLWPHTPSSLVRVMRKRAYLVPLPELRSPFTIRGSASPGSSAEATAAPPAQPSVTQVEIQGCSASSTGRFWELADGVLGHLLCSAFKCSPEADLGDPQRVRVSDLSSRSSVSIQPPSCSSYRASVLNEPWSRESFVFSPTRSKVRVTTVSWSSGSGSSHTNVYTSLRGGSTSRNSPRRWNASPSGDRMVIR